MLLVGNGRVVTRDEAAPFIENGCVAIDGETIKEVGATKDLKAKYPDCEYIDAKGGVIMPGLINMHNHIYSTFARGLSINGYAPHDFMDILDGQWWKIDRTMTLEDTYHSGMVAYADSVKSGVTTMFDHHASFGSIEGSLAKLSEAATANGIRTCLCYEVSDRDGEEKAKASVQENVDFIKYSKQNGGDMQKAMMGMHAAFTISDKTMELCKANMPDDVGIHLHVAEDIADVQDSLKKYGKPVINRVYDLGLLGKQSMVIHCVHIGPHEMELIRDTDTMVTTNPESNMGNAVGCPPAMRMFDMGLLMGLGTDGYTNDMTESYKVGNIIHKHHLADPTTAWTQIPEMLFKNNPIMANRYFEKELGVLKPGAAADVIIVDYNPFTEMNENNVNSHILFGVNGRSVTDTIINGKVKMRNRELVDVDEEKIMADARQQSADLWRRINS